MATRTKRAIGGVIPGGSYLEWSPIIAGAVGAAAISFLLLTFGASIGLTLTSPWPSSGVSIYATVIAVAWWAVIVQIGSFFAGGYLAGRMRTRWDDSSQVEAQFRDGTHGFMVWAVGILFGAVILAMTGTATVKATAQGGSALASAASGNSANANGPVAYAVDGLLRRSSQPAGAAPAANTQNGQNGFGLRNEASRIFTASVANGEISGADRDYLTDTIAARNGISQADAQKRVDASVGQLRDLEVKARVQADKARKIGVIAGFLAAASLLISLGAATAGARLGGNHRDDETVAHLFGHSFW